MDIQKLIKEHRLYFRYPARAGTLLMNQYFGVEVPDDEKFEPSSSSDLLEFHIYSLVCMIRMNRLGADIYSPYLKFDKTKNLALKRDISRFLKAALHHIRYAWLLKCMGAEENAWNELKNAEMAITNARGVRNDFVAASSMLRAQHTSFINKKNADNPRKLETGDGKAINKESILNYIKNFEYENGTVRGAKVAACCEFGIDLKTLNKRLKD